MKKTLTIKGVTWNCSSKATILRLLNASLNTEHGTYSTCVLCEYAEVTNIQQADYTDCINCILPGKGARRCNESHKLFYKWSLPFRFKHLRLVYGKRVRHLRTDETLDPCIRQAIKIIEETPNEQQEEKTS